MFFVLFRKGSPCLIRVKNSMAKFTCGIFNFMSPVQYKLYGSEVKFSLQMDDRWNASFASWQEDRTANDTVGGGVQSKGKYGQG